MGQVIGIAKQLWAQELVWGVLLVLLIIGYVRRFNHIGRTQHLRTQRRHHQETIGHTRLLAILIVIGAVLTFAGHQFWPQVSAVADRVTGVSTSQSSSSTHKKQSASKASSKEDSSSKKKSSSSSSTKTVTAESAVTIVEGYFESHPDEQTDTISQYKAVGTGSDSLGARVFKVGAYGVDDTGATSELHEYWVHRDGKFDVAY